MSNNSRLPLLALLAVAALLIGVVAGNRWFAPKTPLIQSGTLLPKPRPIADFTLTDSSGKPFTRADLMGHWTIIFAGYTSCPDVCPTTLAELKGLESRLGPLADRLDVLFLSVDPERDTPAKLDQYVHYFDPRFRAATGTADALEAMGRNLGFVFEKTPGATPGSYTIDHSAALMLIDPQGSLAGYLVPPFKPDALAADMKNVMENK